MYRKTFVQNTLKTLSDSTTLTLNFFASTPDSNKTARVYYLHLVKRYHHPSHENDKYGYLTTGWAGYIHESDTEHSIYVDNVLSIVPVLHRWDDFKGETIVRPTAWVESEQGIVIKGVLYGWDCSSGITMTVQQNAVEMSEGIDWEECDGDN